jgi:hypothetical protein
MTDRVAMTGRSISKGPGVAAASALKAAEVTSQGPEPRHTIQHAINVPGVPAHQPRKGLFGPA